MNTERHPDPAPKNAPNSGDEPSTGKPRRSAIVLVGGEARRANGMEKYFFFFRGKTFIERLVGSLSEVVDEIILVAKDKEQCERFSGMRDIRCVADVRRGIGPIGGIHAGVVEAKGDLLFICACDMPCIEPQVIDRLFSEIDDFDAVIPEWDRERFEPLHAVYRRTALIGYLEDHTSLSLRDMIKNLHSRYLPVEQLRTMDPDLQTFTNINKIEDLMGITDKKTKN
ncbi:molybdopterin-guanine dinucleotide biosynthesis protein A [Methanolinea mesophila]|uniref:molybdenum cofactor guanylyltransferase n=1 Tax=Methanolinea mesophila TaxID=547055 RepID=UPI001AE8C774|nr:molybdenum cofactor guanylyltransferase [Methanolinea mesophila]MBP1927881.1 molybdopterin-guanine dinucleotide biosynthesis protein A [Methanolinea mesophila]